MKRKEGRTMFEVKDYFITEERQILNDTITQNMTKAELLNDIALQYEMNGDEDYRELLKGLSDKLLSLNEDEISYLVSVVPLEAAYSASLNVDKLPEEEYV